MSGERRSADTRHKILEVAETEFAQKGYEGAHLQAIAQQIGVQKTALYYYFPSKEALYAAVLSTMLDAFDAALTVALERDLPAPEKLLRLVDDLNDLLAERRNFSQILIRIFVDGVRVDQPVIDDKMRGVISRMLVFYRQGVKQGDFAKLSSRNLFMSLLGMTVFYYAAEEFSRGVLDSKDIFSHSTVAWRREEVRRLISHGALRELAEFAD